jgi:hypothetical protein
MAQGHTPPHMHVQLSSSATPSGAPPAPCALHTASEHAYQRLWRSASLAQSMDLGVVSLVHSRHTSTPFAILPLPSAMSRRGCPAHEPAEAAAIDGEGAGVCMQVGWSVARALPQLHGQVAGHNTHGDDGSCPASDCTSPRGNHILPHAQVPVVARSSRTARGTARGTDRKSAPRPAERYTCTSLSLALSCRSPPYPHMHVALMQTDQVTTPCHQCGDQHVPFACRAVLGDKPCTR